MKRARNGCDEKRNFRLTQQSIGASGDVAVAVGLTLDCGPRISNGHRYSELRKPVPLEGHRGCWLADGHIAWNPFLGAHVVAEPLDWPGDVDGTDSSPFAR